MSKAQRSRSKQNQIWSHKHFRGISHHSRMHGHNLIKLSQLLINRSTWQWRHFQGHEFKGQGHRPHFPKTHFSGVWTSNVSFSLL